MPYDVPERSLVQVEQDGRMVWAEQAPKECPGCKAPWSPGRFRAGWMFCNCKPGRTMAPAGHRTYRCGSCGEETRIGHVGPPTPGDGPATPATPAAR